jgi:DNA-binding MarR family transcriptional regulator
MTTPTVARIETALVELRRRQQSGRLGRAAGADAVAGALFRLLDALEAEALGVTELARRVGVDQPRASRLTAEAVRRGLAARQQDPADARRTLLRLTPAGRRVLTRGHETRQEAVAAALSGFDADEARAFAGLLERFLANWPE